MVLGAGVMVSISVVVKVGVDVTIDTFDDSCAIRFPSISLCAL